MQKKTIFVLFSVLVVLALVVSPVYAITGDYVKDNEHPFVGLVVFYDASGQFIWRCSGSLISPTVLLTAGHCADTVGGAVTARVYFQQNAGANYDPALGYDPVSGYPEYCATGTEGVTCAHASKIDNFDFTGSLTLPNTHDVGLVFLDQPITVSEYGQLPTPNYLDQLATARGTKSVVFTASGYGLSYKNQPQSGKPNLSFRERLMAESTLVNLRSAFTDGYNLETQGNGSQKGGTCNGDSGGPMFYGPTSSNLIVGVTSFGLNSLCRGTDYAYRIDQPEVLEWIYSNLDQ
jgi:hypothetical protein